jgi:flagellin-specific chaperone FliS
MSQTEYVKQTIKVNWDKILTKLTKLDNPEKGAEIGAMLKTIFKFSLFEKMKPDVEEVETIIRQG